MAGSPEDIRWPESQRQKPQETISPENIAKDREEIARLLRQSPTAQSTAERIIWPDKTQKHNQTEHQDNPTALSNDPQVRKIQSYLYENLGIDTNTDANGAIKRFEKWLIDGAIIGNAEIARIAWEDPWKFLTTLKDQIFSISWLWQIAKALWVSLKELMVGDAYKRWKSVAELWLITSGLGAVGSVAKYAWKTAIRASVKIGEETALKKAASTTLYNAGRTAEIVGTGLQVPVKMVKKAVVETGKAVGIVSEKTGINNAIRAGARVGNEAYERSGAKKLVEGTKQAVKLSLDTGIATLGATEAVQAVKWKIGEILDTRTQARYEKLEGEWKLIPKERLDIDIYSPEQLQGLKWRLWLAETATKEEVEKAFQLRLYEAMEQYEKLWKKNLERIGTDIMEQMRRNGEKDPKKIISDEILAVKEAYERGEIKIVRVDFYNDKIIQEWFRSPYQVGDARVKPPKYGIKREGIDKDIGLYGLDPKYATVLVNKHELDEMVKKYGKDPNKITMVSVFELEDIKTRSGMTLYDSMLVGGVWRWNRV